MQNFRLIQFSEIDPKSLINPLCVVGMPGIADIGKFAVDQLIGIFQAEKYCEIIFNDYPAGAIVDDSILSTPKAEILIYIDPKRNRDLIFITADAQAMTPKGIYELSDYLSLLIHNFGVKTILSLGAYPINKVDQEKINIYITATNRTLINSFIGCEEVKRVDKGVIIGSNGLIPTLAKARFGIEGVVLLAETDNSAVMNENLTDLEASIKLLEVASKFYNLPIENRFNHEKIIELSEDMEAKRKQLESELDTFQTQIPIPEVDKSLYI